VIFIQFQFSFQFGFIPLSCKQGLTNCDSVSWDEIKELKDFISEQCLKAIYIYTMKEMALTEPQLIQKSVISHDTES
jgi:hypothetical protein